MATTASAALSRRGKFEVSVLKAGATTARNQRRSGHEVVLGQVRLAWKGARDGRAEELGGIAELFRLIGWICGSATRGRASPMSREPNLFRPCQNVSTGSLFSSSQRSFVEADTLATGTSVARCRRMRMSAVFLVSC